MIGRNVLTAAGLATAAMAGAAPALAAPGTTYHAHMALEGAPVDLVCPLEFPMACLDPMEGTATDVTISIPPDRGEIEQLCLILRFQGDLLDPGTGRIAERGERIGIIYPGTFGFGNQAGLHAPQPKVTSCLEAGDDRLAPFLDGEETITVHAVEGSVMLAGVSVKVTYAK